MTLTSRFGPVAAVHYNPLGTWTSDGQLGRGVQITGALRLPAPHQLSELRGDPDAEVTILGVTGTLLFFLPTSPVLTDYQGWILVQSLVFAPYSLHRDTIAADFTLTGILLPASLVPAIVRSARLRPNDFGLVGRATVSSATGFVQSTGGGPVWAREYDASRFGATPVTAQVSISSSSLVFGDAMSSVVIPVDAAELDTPGLRPCAYDRRSGREVYGPAHPFVAGTDALIENGLLRLWCGPVGLVPHVSVSAFTAGAWREVGNLAFADEGDDLVAPPRVTRCTRDEVSLSLTVRRLGRVTLTLCRRERLIRIDYGSTRPGTPGLTRPVRWLGMPPARSIIGATATASARFAAGVALAAGGQLGFAWPPRQPSSAWSYTHSWSPAAASSSQANSGLWSLWSGGSPVGIVRWDAATKTIKWTLGANTLSTAALTFSAGQSVYWQASFSTAAGMTLSTSINGAAAVVVSNAAFVDPGAASYDSHWIGYTTTAFGSGTFGSGTFGGSAVTADLGGAVSNAILFDGPLTAAEHAALAAATTRSAGWPAPLSRAIGYWPFAARPVPLGSAPGTGRRFESTTSYGSTRSADGDGLTKALGVLVADTSSADSDGGFGVARTGTHLLAGAWLATTGTNDDIADHHEELATVNRSSLTMMQEA